MIKNYCLSVCAAYHDTTDILKAACILYLTRLLYSEPKYIYIVQVYLAQESQSVKRNEDGTSFMHDDCDPKRE